MSMTAAEPAPAAAAATVSADAPTSAPDAEENALPIPPVPPAADEDGNSGAATPAAPADPADPFAQRLAEHESEQRRRWDEQVRQWRREAADDPLLGGEKLPVSVARAQLALDRFDEGKHIGRLLERTGYGNHPEVLRFFNRIADALMEDGLVRGRPGADMPPLEERMYAGWSSRG